MLLTLRLLHEFSDTGFFTDPIGRMDLSTIPAWRKHEADMRASKAAV